MQGVQRAVREFRDPLRTSEVRAVIEHDSYPVNLASPDPT